MCLPWQMLGPLPHGRDTLHVCGRRGRMSRGKGGEERGGSGCVQGRAKAALCRVYQAKFGRAKATRSDRHFCPCPLIRRELRGATPRWAGPSPISLSLARSKKAFAYCCFSPSPSVSSTTSLHQRNLFSDGASEMQKVAD